MPRDLSEGFRRGPFDPMRKGRLTRQLARQTYDGSSAQYKRAPESSTKCSRSCRRLIRCSANMRISISISQRVRSSRELALLHALSHARQLVPGYALNPGRERRGRVAHEQWYLCGRLASVLLRRSAHAALALRGAAVPASSRAEAREALGCPSSGCAAANSAVCGRLFNAC